jgi:hypothetical protein
VPYADCPDYAFGWTWYPIPPPMITVVPCILAIGSDAIFWPRLYVSRRLKKRFGPAINVAGLTLGWLPLLATIIVPGISELLHKTTSGC